MGKDIKSEYSTAEWLSIRKAAKAKERSLRKFQRIATLEAAREINRTGSPAGKGTKE